MRGSVPGQIAGALAAWRTLHPDARAFVCPAYPLMGRTVESGRLLVNGEPVERTPFGSDPVTPVKTSDMSELLPDSVTIRMFDAATDADLMKIAESISAAGPSVIPVGSGGLAEAVSEVWSGREESVRRTRREPRRRARRQPDEIPYSFAGQLAESRVAQPGRPAQGRIPGRCRHLSAPRRAATAPRSRRIWRESLRRG